VTAGRRGEARSRRDRSRASMLVRRQADATGSSRWSAKKDRLAGGLLNANRRDDQIARDAGERVIPRRNSVREEALLVGAAQGIAEHRIVARQSARRAAEVGEYAISAVMNRRAVRRGAEAMFTGAEYPSLRVGRWRPSQHGGPDGRSCDNTFHRRILCQQYASRPTYKYGGNRRYSYLLFANFR